MAGDEAIKGAWRQPQWQKIGIPVARQMWRVAETIVPIEFVEELSITNVIRRERVLQGPPLDEQNDEGGLTAQ